uniref:DUF4283 domain-containing protein n=1 Tax=Arundo donax TaxID=35708 RepID=A0A0A9GUN4_ARUDO
MRMRIVPSVVIKVNRWYSSLGSKGSLDEAWFRIKGIPIDKRSEPNVYHVGSLVGLSLELDKRNLTKFDYVRVKIGCRDVTKVPAIMERMLGKHFYDFYFQREILQEGSTNPAGNKWVRTGGDDGNNGDKPSPKKQKTNDNFGTVTSTQQGQSTNTSQGTKSAPPKFMADAQKLYNNMGPSPTPQPEKESKGKETVIVEEVEDSDEEEDEGLLIGDIICPSGDAYIFCDPRYTNKGGEVRKYGISGD